MLIPISLYRLDNPGEPPCNCPGGKLRFSVVALFTHFSWRSPVQALASIRLNLLGETSGPALSIMALLAFSR